MKKRDNRLFVLFILKLFAFSLFYYSTSASNIKNTTPASSSNNQSDRDEATQLFNAGNLLVDNHDYLHALEKFYRSLELSNETGEVKSQIETLKKIGVVHVSLTRYDRAEFYFQEAFSIAKKIGDTATLIDVFVVFAQIDIEKQDFTSANTYLLNALNLATKCIDRYPVKTSLVYRNLGLLNLKQTKYQQALYYYDKTLNVDFAIKNYCQIGSLYTLIGHIYGLLGQYSISQEYNFKALKARKDFGQSDQYASSLLNIGNTYLKIDKKDSALSYLQSGIKISSDLKVNCLLEYGYKSLFDLYNSNKDYPYALKYFKLYSAYKDSVTNENNRKDLFIYLTNQAISDQEKSTSKLVHENAIQKLLIKERTIFFFLFLFLFLFMVVFSIFIYYVLVKSRKAKKVVEDLNFSLTKEINERIQTEQKLLQSETNYKFIADNVLDVITRFDLNFKRNFISASCERVWGYTSQELYNIKDILSIVHPDSVPVFFNALAEIKQKKEPIKMIYKARRKDGKIFWAQNHVNPILDPSTGELVEMISVMRDITNQKEQEDALVESARKKELLIKEVNHRVKNNLSILASLTGMHRNTISDKKVMDMFTDLQFRVRTMALVHEQLYSTRNIEALHIGNYLSNLVNIISTSFNDNRVKIFTAFEEELLDPAIGLTVGLIVNELITNVFKHAFPDNATGNLWIEYKSLPPASERPELQYRCLIIRDNGIGLPKDFKINQDGTLGNQILSLLVDQIGAKLIIESNNGACFTISIPINENK